jgi:hypothetical protein
MKNFQQDGVVSNAHAERDFESAAKEFFATIHLGFDLALPIGVGDLKKEHTFDLGNREGRVIVECKSHTWPLGSHLGSKLNYTLYDRNQIQKHPVSGLYF